MYCLFLGGGGGVKKYDKDLGLLELHKNLLKTFQFFLIIPWWWRLRRNKTKKNILIKTLSKPFLKNLLI